MTRIGFLGVGHLAEEMITGLLRSGLPAGEMILSPRGLGPKLAERHGIALAADNGALVAAAEIVLLATRPGDAVAAMTGLGWRPGQILVSACAGVPLADLRAAAAPAEVVRIMPLTAASIGASPTTVYPDLSALRPLLARLGAVIPLADEAGFETATVSAAIYGWAQVLIGLGRDWSLAQGLAPETARQLAAETFVAAGRMIAERPEPVEALLTSLATPGGITECGLKVLEAGDVEASWIGACDAVLEKLTGAPASTRRA
ncbi:Pyrroline-5-carboxylate reductase [Bosea sp. 62]|uniref:pyrroline-5-carboxylate reductase family protein n=1 Tax=unclassified Bosea (in: a-proteobacteria) TaxID=2653178 RepID=UPI00125C27C0|nr:MULTISPECIES: pyrroline-5-carboxylate reductase dimerization domain-containing protein [unclassified Bosea (in: a-proteobacteria)]CAD5256259.1 Pyrroline-5-carboxylate reductase [Bosea sp. 7B]CAD5274327.1 Pyrroline-5-carboxylate reductase [Bosea sp. 21B]CAD5275521.1 Pyrroline-5-carboxylate reductase [Bosea sp. 46]VVT60110.1 Pyrroline-5-carboxylate reductase [Bosea sp. EC-HK365B]VXB55662.1 Pyrroline-5-carboxylate reductase [Bosea sp. 62]